ncbi:MAG: AAA family ATPase [Acidobacteria bacterium]|nr:AAA family ATPase [Acidobacteriota bacterium]
MYQAGLAPEGRPVGVFLLLGPTGTGKTRTVEVLAEVLHGSDSRFLKVDCGEFQGDHEIARLIGAPPGYLGHRETQPMITQQKLNDVTTRDCDVSVVLFDEIEKAAPALVRLLLGVLDRATLHLGDNTSVSFERSFIFLPSNLGAREMMKELQPAFGFRAGQSQEPQDLSRKLESIGLAAVRKKFSPEFVNRMDAIVTYQPLDKASLASILDLQLSELQRHVNTRLGESCFQIEVPAECRQFLLDHGTSKEYGARELKRTVHRYLTQPLATMVASEGVGPGSLIRADISADGERLFLHPIEHGAAPQKPRGAVLIVDDNRELLQLLKAQSTRAGYEVVTAETARGALELVKDIRPAAAVLDYMLPDTDVDGVELGIRLKRLLPEIHVIIMSGANLTEEEYATCRQMGFPLLTKPFLDKSLLKMLEDRISSAKKASAC